MTRPSKDTAKLNKAEVPATVNELVAEIKEIVLKEQQLAARRELLMSRIRALYAETEKQGIEAFADLFNAYLDDSYLEEAIAKWQAYRKMLHELGWVECYSDTRRESHPVNTFEPIANVLEEINRMLKELKELNQRLVHLYNAVVNSSGRKDGANNGQNGQRDNSAKVSTDKDKEENRKVKWSQNSKQAAKKVNTQKGGDK